MQWMMWIDKKRGERCSNGSNKGEEMSESNNAL